MNTAEGWARANILYDKADRPPKAGSLREALFLHVWLKREEQRVKGALVLAEGMAEMVASSGGKTKVPDKFKEFVLSVFPFLEKEEVNSDMKMKEVMKREVAKGPIQFTSVANNTLKAAAKRLSMPDEFKERLRAKASKRLR